MDYISNSKNRKLKNKIHMVFNRLSFNFLHLSSEARVIWIWLIISFFSLFGKWFSIVDNTVQGNAFSLHAGYVGYIILALLTFLFFLLLSNREKEKIKTRVHFPFSDHTMIIFSGITILLLTFVVFNSIRGFVLFYQNIIIGKGIIFECIGAIFIIFWWYVYYRGKKQELLRTVYVENNQSNASLFEDYEELLSRNDPNKENMTLPL
jgi:uncharacterized membrane protein SirB2